MRELSPRVGTGAGVGWGGGMELVRDSLGVEAGGTQGESNSFTDWRELLGGERLAEETQGTLCCPG